MSLLVDAGDIVFPKEPILRDVGNKPLCIGPGLVRSNHGTFAAEKFGIVRRHGNLSFYIDSLQDTYVPVRGEYVIGVVRAKLGDNYALEIGANQDAIVSYLAFESATKRNRPNVKLGDVIFGRLIMTVPDAEPELVCIDAHGKRAGMGILNDGHVFQVPVHHARRLLHPSCSLFEILGKELKYETTVGMNGRVWVKAASPRDVLAVKKAVHDLLLKPTADVGAIVNSALSWRARMPYIPTEPETAKEDLAGTEERVGGTESATVSNRNSSSTSGQKGGGTSQRWSNRWNSAGSTR